MRLCLQLNKYESGVAETLRLSELLKMHRSRLVGPAIWPGDARATVRDHAPPGLLHAGICGLHGQNPLEVSWQKNPVVCRTSMVAIHFVLG